MQASYIWESLDKDSDNNTKDKVNDFASRDNKRELALNVFCYILI
jgi:hypothetical protein